MSSLAPSRLRFTVEDYYQMAETGILQSTDRVELLDGEIFHMSPIGSRHAASVDRLLAAFQEALAPLPPPDRPIVRCQSPVRLDTSSEPEPDLALLRPRPDFYAESHPGPADLLLVVEVAETSLGFDRAVKLPLYARAGVPEVWVLDVVERCLEIHRAPSEITYAERLRRGAGETVDVQLVPAAQIALDRILV